MGKIGAMKASSYRRKAVKRKHREHVWDKRSPVKKNTQVAKKAASIHAAKLKVVHDQKKRPTISSKVTPKKKISPTLLAALEKRNAQKSSQRSIVQLFTITKRRGRRPKQAKEYVAYNNQEENSYVLESDTEGLEMDTGLKFKDKQDEMINLEREEDFDEELNFD